MLPTAQQRKLTLAAFSLGLLALSAGPSLAAATDDALEQRIEKLEQELAELKQQHAAEAAAAPAKASPATTTAAAPTVTLDSNGLRVVSSDQNVQVALKGYAQADARTFVGEGHGANTDQFLIRSARPIVEASLYNQFTARLQLDFGNGQANLLDAYADYQPDAAVNLRVGKFKDPIGLERAQPEQTLLFTERGLANDLVPYRDIGVEVYGRGLADTVDYQLAFTDGAPDLANINGDADSKKDLIGRLFLHPFHGSATAALREIGFGVAGSTGLHQGSPTNTNVSSGYVTPGQAKFFAYRSDAFSSGTEWRVNPQVTYLYGPFSLLGEYVTEDQTLKRGASTGTFSNSAWTAETSYLLTGEDARFDGVRPHANFNPGQHTWGAVEVVGRVSELRVDSRSFVTFADPSVSAQRAEDFTGGVNWYLNPNVKLQGDYSYTTFKGGNTSGRDRAPEKAFVTRAQIGF